MFKSYFRKILMITVGAILILTNFLVVKPARAVELSTNVPGAPILTAISINSINIVIDQNANDPAATKYAIFNQTENEYVNLTGNLQASEDWESYSAFGSASGVLNVGLVAGTTYSYQVKAVDINNIPTDFSTSTSAATFSIPTLEFSTNSLSVPISNGSFSLPLSLSAPAVNVGFDCLVTGGTAVEGTDYIFDNNNIILLNIHLIGANKTIIFTLSNPQNVILGTNKTLVVTIVNDNKTPTGSFQIDSGASETNNRNLNLSLSYQHATKVEISLDPNFIGVVYQNIAKSLNFTLPDADGSHTIYLKYKDQYGNESVVYSQKIILDRVVAAPVVAVSRQNGQIIVSWNDVEADASYEVYRDGILVATTSSLMFVEDNLTRGQNYTYYVVATDAAGNSSSPSNSVTVYLPNPQISSISFESAPSVTISPQVSASSQVSSLTPEVQAKQQVGTVQAATTNANQVVTNWALIIAIILAGLLILGGGLYWWYSREEDEI